METKVLSQIVKLLHEKLPKRNYLHIDETHVQVLNESRRKNAIGFSYVGIQFYLKLWAASKTV